MKRIVVLSGALGLFAMGAFVHGQGTTKIQDEQDLRRIESATAKFEQRNDASGMGSLAEDWV
jgi:hypothetical protein